MCQCVRVNFDSDRFWQAIEAADPRFDGWVFCGVRTTGIYCRPSCPARTPKRENVAFFVSAAAAQGAGFRACKRCRPDATPGSPDWDLRADLVGRAMRLIADGVVDREGVGGLASRLGYSERHVHRQLIGVVGAGPLALARAQRAQTARILLETTDVPITGVAFAAGFQSVRQFNATIQEVFALSPRALRARVRRGERLGDSAALSLRLPYRSPLDGDGLIAFLGLRAVPGVEEVLDGAYRRSLRLPRGAGIVELRPADGYVRARYWLEDLRDLAAAIQRARTLLDLDSDPHSVLDALGRDRLLGRLVRDAPGRRVAGHVDGDELAVRAVLGQQVSLRGAATLAGRLVAAYGQPLELPLGNVTHLFPTPAALAGADPGRLAMPRAARARCWRSHPRSPPASSRWTAAPSVAMRVRGCSRCRGSGRGPPSTSRCVRCAIPTRSCPRTSGSAMPSSSSARTAGRRRRRCSPSAGAHTGHMPCSTSGRRSLHPGEWRKPRNPAAMPNGWPREERDQVIDQTTRPMTSVTLHYTTVSSPIGELLLLGDGEALHGLYMQDGGRPARVAASWEESAAPFVDVREQLREYFAGERTSFDVTLAPRGAEFELRVWRALREIPYGETVSYGEIARRVGQPQAARAVGLANGRNPIAVIVPCHRVIGADGSLTGYGGGLERKRLLLELECGQARL